VQRMLSQTNVFHCGAGEGVLLLASWLAVSALVYLLMWMAERLLRLAERIGPSSVMRKDLS